MRIYKNLNEIESEAKGCVVAIGNFDGVHKGHHQILDRGRSIAQELGKAFGVLTFEPHPRRLFRPDDPPFRITPERLKQERLEKSGVECLYSLTFDWDFASQSAEEFIETVLKQGLDAAHIIVGFDFCFGQLRKGSPAMIETSGIPTTIMDQIDDQDDEAYSSSAIRQHLKLGDIEKANALLGWDWCIEGKVTHGDKRGRELGYPTANVPLGDTTHPAYGVYATFVQIEGEDIWRPSATNIGIRPMFEAKEGLVEAFIFDFDQEIYDKTLRIKPIKRLRGEAKFDSLDDLITQMAKDCEQAKDILESLI